MVKNKSKLYFIKNYFVPTAVLYRLYRVPIVPFDVNTRNIKRRLTKVYGYYSNRKLYSKGYENVI